jgi:hypothetical protein
MAVQFDTSALRFASFEAAATAIIKDEVRIGRVEVVMFSDLLGRDVTYRALHVTHDGLQVVFKPDSARLYEQYGVASL